MPLVDGEFIPLEFPSEKHARVLMDHSRPWRYRVLYGGRNGYKDWSIAATAIERAVRCPTRFLFTREVQLTLADSAHQLLKDTITRLGYDGYFTVLEKKIICHLNGSSIIFRGLNEKVSGDVKSMEGIDIAVVMEAEDLDEKSFCEDLDPTVRKPGSEIWIAFNTKQETGFVYNFCVTNPPENMLCEKVTYLDTNNPDKMLSPVILDQANRMKLENYELYKNTWLGEPLTLGLFFKEFGNHNECIPFVIPEHSNRTLIGSLDHGLVHNTSFGLSYISEKLDMFRMFTYSECGGTTRAHAEAILEKIESFSLSRYQFPSIVFYDYSMDEKHKQDEWDYKSDIDIYKEVFGAHPLGKMVRFVKANKNKVPGCSAMRGMFVKVNGRPQFYYFAGMNKKFVTSIKNVVTDDTNTEVYSKMDGDDETDECRYSIMGAMSICSGIRSSREYASRHTPHEHIKPLSSTLKGVFFSSRRKAA
jgi:phage terminase large subunit